MPRAFHIENGHWDGSVMLPKWGMRIGQKPNAHSGFWKHARSIQTYCLEAIFSFCYALVFPNEPKQRQKMRIFSVSYRTYLFISRQAVSSHACRVNPLELHFQQL